MDVKVFNAYNYYGTGVDEENIAVKYNFYIDDVMYARIQAVEQSTVIYEGHNVSLTPSEVVDAINTYLGARWIGTQIPYYYNDPYTDQVSDAIANTVSNNYRNCGILIKPIRQHSGVRQQQPTKISLINGSDLNQDYIGGLHVNEYITVSSLPDQIIIDSSVNDCGTTYATLWTIQNKYYFTNSIQVFPSDYFLSGGVNSQYASTSGAYLTIRYTCTRDYHTNEILKVTDFTVSIGKSVDYVYSAFESVDLTGSMPEEIDYSNPYSENGNSGRGGGNGTLDSGMLDDVDGAEIPNIPGISAADLGFITMYNPSVAELKSLSAFMWSGAFDLATYKKLFSDPMQSIIGLAIVPVKPTIAGLKSVHFGSIDSGISMNYLSTNYVQVNCGSVEIERYIGCFMDNEPYTKVSIYLPFIGIRQLSADDIIGGSIHVVYNIDVLTGACACFIEHSSRGVLYSYNGSCITNVPLTAVNFSGAIQNAVSAIGSAIGMVAGMATGAAPIAAMSAVGLATSAANTAINSKPTVQRSGNLGGSAGILSILTPYVIIERPDMSVPSNIQHYVGQTSNITMSLGACKGFTMCEFVHIDNVAATSDELLEIESLLKAGVIL